MRDDMTIISIPVKGTLIRVYAIGDVHLGAAEHMSKEWGRFLKMIEEDENAYLILTGDMMNNATKSSVSDIYSEVCSPSEQKKILHDQLYMVKDRILCGVMGNHENRSKKDVDLDPLYDVFVMLGIPERYRQNMAFLRLRLSHPESGKNLGTYHFCVAHGSTKTKNRNFANYVDGLDVMITSHTHDAEVDKPSKLVFDRSSDRIRIHPMVHINAVSWMAYGGYGARKMYAPKTVAQPQHLVLESTSRASTTYKQMKVIW